MKLGRSVGFVCNVNVVDESFVWCRHKVSKPAFQVQSLKVVGAVPKYKPSIP